MRRGLHAIAARGRRSLLAVVAAVLAFLALPTGAAAAPEINAAKPAGPGKPRPGSTLKRSATLLFACLATLLGLSGLALAAIVDSDNDRMSDSWEKQNGLQVGVKDGQRDPDDDDLTNYMESRQPSDPHDRLSPGKRVLLGALVGSRPGQTKEETFSKLEQNLGRDLAVHRQFISWEGGIVTWQARTDLDMGRIPFIGWKTVRSDGSYVRWADIAQGRYDAWIRQQASEAREFGAPMIISFHHEPENDVGVNKAGSPADYRAASRRVAAIFEQQRATNVKFAFVLMAGAYERGDADRFYPGDAYVDYIGSNFFNFYPTKEGAPWRVFKSGLTAFRRWGKGHNKPLVVGAFGAQEDPERPRRKARWIRSAFNTLKEWPEVRIICYFHSKRGRVDWSVGTSASSLAAFKEMSNQLYFRQFDQLP